MSANFEPNQNKYKNLTPFKCWLLHQINNWGLNNFPFVESDFDELTNYGMLMKMMKALNDVISNQNKVEQDMTNLFNAFTELQTYVNNYFDNLDVQDEIDNKLDEMAESGLLSHMLNDYVLPYVDSLKNQPTLFIGDSYLNASTNYGDYYKTLVGLSDDYYFRYASPGAGWSATGTGGKTYAQVLDLAIAGMTSAQKQIIKNIIVGCGINDANYTQNATQISNGIQSFMSKVASNFPNANVYVITCGYAIGTDKGSVRTLLSNVTLNTTLNANYLYAKQPIFLDGSNFWLRKNDLFLEDGFHPNANGQLMIARNLIRNMSGQKYQFINGQSSITITLTDNTTTKSMDCRQRNDCVLISWNDIDIETITSTTGNSQITLGTWSNDFIHPNDNLAVAFDVTIQIRSSNVFYYHPASLRLLPDHTCMMMYRGENHTNVDRIRIYSHKELKSLWDC